MIHRRTLLGGVAAASALLAATGASAQASPLHGSWTGALNLGSSELRLKLELGDGKAVLYSLDQGGQPIPGEVVTLTDKDVHVRFPAIQGSYRGKLVGDALEGEFSQGSPLPLRLVREGSAAAAASTLAAMDQGVLDGLRAQSGAPAMIAGVAGAGAPKLWVSGVRSAGQAAPATTADLWHVGSITKSMTATLVARMVEASRLGWDDPLPVLLPALASDIRADYRKVTMRHLLSHRAGLLANLPAIGFGMATADPRDERLAYARSVLGAPPVGAPEQTFAYSNAGYVVAAAVLEQRLGQPWEALIQAQVFQPLGIRSAGFGAPGRKGELSQPVGHAAGADGKPQPYGPEAPVNDNPAVLGPAGRVHMTVADLLTFVSAHRDRHRLLKPESWDLLHTPPFGGDYAMGWVVRPDGLIWHNGSNTLWYAEAAFDRKRGRSAAAIANDGRTGTSQPAVGRALKSAFAAG